MKLDSVASLAEVVAAAPAGSGVGCHRNSSCAHLHLDLRALNQIRFYEPGDLTVGADAGVTAAQINALLEPHGQWLPLDVPVPGRMTLGALLATHAAGPLCQGFGTVRDFTIGIEIVSAAGALIAGGGRVVKNVAGYDLMKLAIGSRGTVGIISGVNFKVLTRPQHWETALFHPAAWPAVEALRSALLHSPLRPAALELSFAPAQGITVAVRYHGSPAVRARYRDELARLGTCDLLAAGASETDFWAAAADFPITTDTSCAFPPAQAVAALAPLAARGATLQGRLGLGLYWVRGVTLPPSSADPAAAALMARIKHTLDPEGRLHGDACGR